MSDAYFARWKLLDEFFGSVRFVHLEFIFAGNGQLRSTVLSSDLSFVRTKVARKGVERLECSDGSDGVSEVHGQI